MLIKDFTIRQPQFWAVLVESSQNVTLQGFLVNATNTDPAANGTNWVQNTDGCDTYRSDDVRILDWVYDGGDDCIAFVRRRAPCPTSPTIALVQRKYLHSEWHLEIPNEHEC